MPFPVGTRVVNDRWGEGTVQRYDADQVTVLFDEHGYRDLYLPVVLERGLLRLAGTARPLVIDHATSADLPGNHVPPRARPAVLLPRYRAACP